MKLFFYTLLFFVLCSPVFSSPDGPPRVNNMRRVIDLPDIKHIPVLQDDEKKAFLEVIRILVKAETVLMPEGNTNKELFQKLKLPESVEKNLPKRLLAVIREVIKQRDIINRTYQPIYYDYVSDEDYISGKLKDDPFIKNWNILEAVARRDLDLSLEAECMIAASIYVHFHYNEKSIPDYIPTRDNYEERDTAIFTQIREAGTELKATEDEKKLIFEWYELLFFHNNAQSSEKENSWSEKLVSIKEKLPLELLNHLKTQEELELKAKAAEKEGRTDSLKKITDQLSQAQWAESRYLFSMVGIDYGSFSMLLNERLESEFKSTLAYKKFMNDEWEYNEIGRQWVLWRAQQIEKWEKEGLPDYRFLVPTTPNSALKPMPNL